jgi:hypothetical protein
VPHPVDHRLDRDVPHPHAIDCRHAGTPVPDTVSAR